MNVDLVTRSSSVIDDELWPVYEAVFGDAPTRTSWQEGTWDRHGVRDGFRLALAHADHRLVGFAYGYTGQRGQWWTDRAASVLAPEVARDWLGGHFEVVSLGVLADQRSRGLGSALLTHLLADLPHERALLMTTADVADPARRLYDRLGLDLLGPGLAADQVILGRRHPAGTDLTGAPAALLT